MWVVDQLVGGRMVGWLMRWLVWRLIKVNKTCGPIGWCVRLKWLGGIGWEGLNGWLDGGLV